MITKEFREDLKSFSKLMWPGFATWTCVTIGLLIFAKWRFNEALNMGSSCFLIFSIVILGKMRRRNLELMSKSMEELYKIEAQIDARAGAAIADLKTALMKPVDGKYYINIAAHAADEADIGAVLMSIGAEIMAGEMLCGNRSGSGGSGEVRDESACATFELIYITPPSPDNVVPLRKS